MRYPAMDLIAGERYWHTDQHGEKHEVTVEEVLGMTEDRFGGRVRQLVCSSDGRRGIVFLGERASVDVIV